MEEGEGNQREVAQEGGARGAAEVAMTQRHRAWADQIINTQLVDGATLLLDLLENAPTIDTMTAVRILLDVEAGWDPAVSTEGDVRISVGIGVTSTEAFSIGVTAVPNPDSETEYPPRGWLYVATKRATIAIGGSFEWQQNAKFEVDLRAMRKIDKGILFLHAKNTAMSDPGTIRLVGRTRVLCLT